VYFHFRSDLDYNINSALRARAEEVATLARGEPPADTRGDLGRLPTSGDNFVQILDRSRQVLGASAGYAAPPLLTRAEVTRAGRVSRMIERGERQRLYAMPLSRERDVVVAGVSLSARDAALDKLDDSLFIGVPPALLLASLAAYLLAGAALAPVERIRRRAATISADGIATRLPLPPSDDEIRRLGETLNAMLDRLEAGIAHQRAFVANASHELRMPLAVLKAELEVALREHGDADALRASIASAAEETDRIVTLAEDLLLLARAQDGTLPIAAREVGVHELLAELAVRMEPAVRHAGRALVVDVDALPERASVAVDGDRVSQAVANLVDNALRHGAGPLTLSARVVGDAVELHVSDRGPGFDPAFLDRAFDRFTRADPARGRGGVGLGLALVRTIAQAHGGDAGAGNLPGGGADVWLALPARRRHGDRPPAPYTHR
jgi:signal transduction histidine kinase